jgi:hypothetical protein
VVFSPPCNWLSVPSPLGVLSLPGATECFNWKEEAFLPVNQGGKFHLHKGAQKGSGTNLGASFIKLVRTQVRIQEADGVSDQLPERYPSNHLFRLTSCLSGSGSGVEVLCFVRVCESASLRCSLVMKLVWSPNPWFCGEILWSRVSLNMFSNPGLM